jgi:2,3-bisphosphoglycerate-independent phosphoglycerate mutase
LNHRPIVLIVLDGWGERPERQWNAIRADAHFWHGLLERYPHALLSASGREVGLPLDLMGNSEVGHTNLGAGRIVYQEITRIDKSIEDGDFFTNGAFTRAFDRAAADGRRVHLIGLVSDGGVHSSDQHLRHLLQLAKGRNLRPEQVLVHAITDGRDTPPRSSLRYIEALERDIAAAGVGRIASVVGRYFAMDRDTRWDRTQLAYDLFTAGAGQRFTDAAAAVRASYAADTGDEFIAASVIGEPEAAVMQDGDVVLCFNFRADRMRQLVSALGLEDFHGFERQRRPRLELVTMTQYRKDLPFAVAYPPTALRGTLPEVLAAHELRQLRVAETEKYAHVTYFFNGGREEPLPGERRILVPSPKVATYDLQPEMSAAEVTDQVLAAVAGGEVDVIVVNFANADMVGHTGLWGAVLRAVQTVDRCLERIVPEVTRRGGLVMITSDHGNAEQLWDFEHDSPHTAHTTNPVPIVLCADDLIGARLRPMGILADVAPTLLKAAGLEQPPEMDGVSLL